jgi:hypothetical protein
MMEEVTYTLVCNGKEYSTITRTEVHRGRLYESVVFPMYEAIAKANKIASELFYDNQTGNYFGDHEREQEFLELLETLNKAISIMKD